VATGDHLRLFCALRRPGETVDRLTAWQTAHLTGVRPVDRTNLHVTLAFLGARPGREVPAIARELAAAVAGAAPIVLGALRYRETRSVGMVVLSDEGGAATALATDLAGRLRRRSGRSVRPMPLSTLRCCGLPARSIRFWNRLR
jgi:2'-5' RNA ligase